MMTMAEKIKKRDLRDGLPSGSGPVTLDELERDEDTHVESEPDVLSPEVGKNIPSGQITKG